MTDIHKLHTDLFEKYRKEWLKEVIIDDNKCDVRWKKSEIMMFQEIMKQIKGVGCLTYTEPCLTCESIQLGRMQKSWAFYLILRDAFR